MANFANFWCNETKLAQNFNKFLLAATFFGMITAAATTAIRFAPSGTNCFRYVLFLYFFSFFIFSLYIFNDLNLNSIYTYTTECRSIVTTTTDNFEYFTLIIQNHKRKILVFSFLITDNYFIEIPQMQFSDSTMYERIFLLFFVFIIQTIS